MEERLLVQIKPRPRGSKPTRMRNDKSQEHRTDEHRHKIQAVDVSVLRLLHQVTEIQQPATHTEPDEVITCKQRRRRTSTRNPAFSGRHDAHHKPTMSGSQASIGPRTLT